MTDIDDTGRPVGPTGPLSETGWLGGRVRLLQAERGYRAGMDAALLAATVDLKPTERLIEAGCGAGAVLAAVATRNPGGVLSGVERDRDTAALARRNAALNGIEADVVEADVDEGFRATGLAAAHWAIANPPFFDDPKAMRGPSESKRGAWMADGGVGAWMRFLGEAVREDGRIVVIHRADRLADILKEMPARMGSLVIQTVHPRADTAAKRVIVGAIKGGKAPLRLPAPLVLHEGDGGAPTARADALMRGEAGLDLW